MMRVCDACRSAEQKWAEVSTIDWEKRAQEFETILTSLPKHRTYDCVVPVSGVKIQHTKLIGWLRNMA